MRTHDKINNVLPGSGFLQTKNIKLNGELSGDDLITNGSFETAGGGGADILSWWLEFVGTGTNALDTTYFYTGTKSLKLTSGTTKNNYVNSPQLTVVPGETYLLSMYNRGDTLSDGLFSIYDNTHSTYILPTDNVRNFTTGWVRRDVFFVVPSGCVKMSVFLITPYLTGSNTWYDLVTLKKWTPPTIFYDDFRRADGDPWKSPGGFPYMLKNTGSLGNLTIKSGFLDMPASLTGYGYLYVTLPKIPKILSSNFRWKSDYAGNGDSSVIACSNDINNFVNLRSMLHFYITQTTWVLQSVDSGNNYTTLANGALSLSANTDYLMQMVISGNTATLTIPTIDKQVVTHSNIGTFAGQQIFYEIIRTASDKKTPILSYIKAEY